MSAVKRVISGTLALWLRIFVTIISQIIAVPLYLSYWSIETYGTWILIQSIITFLTIFDIAHHNYLGNEFLKLGKKRTDEIGAVLFTGLVTALIVAVLIFLTFLMMTLSGLISQWAGIEDVKNQAFEISLLITLATWILTITYTGIVGRALYPFGYYPLCAWSGVLIALMTTTSSMAAVYFGFDLIGTTIATCIVTLICNSILSVILFRLAKKENLIVKKLNIKLGFSRFFASLGIGAQSGLDILRLQGVRFILLPLSGMGQMIAFSTMRTGANLAQQGIGTITGPLMPELMGYLTTRDQPRTESAFAVIWLVLCVVLVPAVLIIQFIAPILFPIWTQGKIDFNPLLFSLLSLGVLVSALAQPPIAVVNGNNLVLQQFIISVISTSTTVGGIYLMVPRMGITGAALALLLGEIITLASYVYVAKKWLVKAEMRWPNSAFANASLSIVVAAFGMGSMIYFPNYGDYCLILALTAQLLVIAAYWSKLPYIARQRAASQAVRILPALLRKRFHKPISHVN